MWTNVGIFRNEQTLKTALDEINKISLKFNRTGKCFNQNEYELRDMLIVAKLIIESALRRKESRGAHYRVDYLDKNETCEHSTLTKKEGELSLVK